MLIHCQLLPEEQTLMISESKGDVFFQENVFENFVPMSCITTVTLVKEAKKLFDDN